MPKKIIVTGDGSPSIEWQEGVTYHSTFGAMQESRHIYIERGWRTLATQNKTIRVFELGMGTGLNALLTLMEVETMQLPVYYEAVEAFPLEAALFEKLDYCAQLGCPHLQPKFLKLHTCDWETPVSISPCFTFYKSLDIWPHHELGQPAELVYYDAFDPVVQPELWSAEVFRRLAAQLAPGALLLTYCSKGIVRRAMEDAGFRVEKLPGPPGKREVVRAVLVREK